MVYQYQRIAFGLALAVIQCGPLTHVNAAGGMTWEGGVTVVSQATDDSRVGTETTGSADLMMTLSQDRGAWFLYLEASTSPASDGVSAFYPTANGDAGSVLTAGGQGTLQVSEFNYTIQLAEDGLLALGLIDPSAWLDRGRIANDENIQFLNGSLVNNATIAFPDYTLGGVLQVPASAGRPKLVVVLAGSDGLADTPDRSYQDLLDLNEAGRGAFLGSGASWTSDSRSFRVGGWLRTDDLESDESGARDGLNYGVYSVFGWQSGANAISVRAGAANSAGSAADRFLSLSMQRRTAFGVIGAGIAGTGISKSVADRRDTALDGELYFRIPVDGDRFHVTPSIQYIDIPANEQREASSAVIVGVRLRLSF